MSELRFVGMIRYLPDLAVGLMVLLLSFVLNPPKAILGKCSGGDQPSR